MSNRRHDPSGTPPRKIDELRAFIAHATACENAAAEVDGAGDMAATQWARALAFAAKFPVLGRFKQAIERGHQAATRPDFVRAIGRDPAADIAAGIAALRERYEEQGKWARRAK